MTASLSIDDDIVAEYADGQAMDAVDSPRPYLHAVRTHAGLVTTDERPEDHHHHHGVSFAVPDVDGVSYWGGRTYVRDAGSTLLDNHGVQRSVSRSRSASGILETLTWIGRDGLPQFEEERRLSALRADEGWILDWRSLLIATRDVSIGSPATNGRHGAFYGGIFWRTPFSTATAVVESGLGEAAAHGSSSQWLAVTTPRASLVALGDGRPWFVRTDGYVGFGPALAVDDRLRLASGAATMARLSVLVTDRGDLDVATAAALADDVRRRIREQG